MFGSTSDSAGSTLDSASSTCDTDQWWEMPSFIMLWFFVLFVVLRSPKP